MTETLAPVGFRFGCIYELNANGRPNATSPSTSYTGLEFSGPKAYNLSIPNPRQIVHTGKDSVVAQDQLPSLEATAAEILVSGVDYDLDALMQNTLKFTVGQATMLARNTDQAGSEPVVGLLLYRQAKVIETGLRRWLFHIIPSTQAIPIPAAWGDAPTDHRYTLSPSPVTKHLWGVTLTMVTEGALRAGIFDGHMAGKPFMDNWQSDGVEDAYVLTYESLTNTYAVFVNGVERTANITKTTTGFTFTSAIPANGQDINVLYARAS